MTVPPEAITAAAEAIERELMSGNAPVTHIESDELLAKAALEAAVPLIAAAERDRIRQLAEKVNAGYYHKSDPEPLDRPPGATMTTGSYEPFADLLRDEP